MPSNRHSRRSIRLRDYDYTQNGAYFVTICCHERLCLFGNVNDDGEMVLNERGRIALECWLAIPKHFPQVELDYVVMPNHVHGIIVITTPHILQRQSVGAQHAAPLRASPKGITPNNVTPGSLGAIVRAYKSAVTKRINERRGTPALIWQRNYHEHIIRNEQELHTLWEYVQYNPMRRMADRYNPQNDHP